MARCSQRSCDRSRRATRSVAAAKQLTAPPPNCRSALASERVIGYPRTPPRPVSTTTADRSCGIATTSEPDGYRVCGGRA
jgi:hypothetical protein